MSLFLDRLLAWFGLKERKQRSTIPPPRINERWNKPFPKDAALPHIPEHLDAEKTNNWRVPRHARKRPPKHDRGKP